MYFMLTRISFISCLLCVFFALASPVYGQGSCRAFKPMTFGILPFISAEQLVVKFTPLVHYLSEHLNTPIRIETAPDFMAFAQRTQQQRYDILFTAPHFYAKANQVGYQLIARVDSPGMSAVIVAPRKSHIDTLDDLKGKRLASLHKESLASILLRKHLREHGIDPDRDLSIISTPTHDASLLSSYHGITDASALMQPPYEAASEQVRQNMRVIATTERAPHIPISVSARLSPQCGQEISRLLLSMGNTDEGRSVLKNNRFSGFRKASEEDYKKIKALLVQ